MKKAAIEIDELMKLLLMGIGLIVLLFIVGFVLRGEFTTQLDKMKHIFDIFK